MTARPTDARHRGDAVAMGAAVAMFAVALVWRFLTFSGFSNDHYAHFALAQQLLLGERPIRDFADPGWPLTYLLSALAWWLAGDTMWVEWTLIGVAMALAAAFTVLATHRLAGSLWVAILVTLLELVVYPRTYSYPKLLTYAVGAWLMIGLAERPTTRRLTAMSAVIAVAFLLRHDHGLYIGVAAALGVALASVGQGWRVALGRVTVLTAVTAAWLLPWILFVVANGGLPAYLDRALEYAQAESNATTLRSWPRFALVPGKPLLGLERPDRPLAQVRWKPDISDADRTALERRYRIDYVRDSDDARWYYVSDPSADNLRALADDPHAAETSGLGRAGRPMWREILASLSPFRVAPALHSASNADAWLYWLFWGLPAVCVLLAFGRWWANAERWPGELATVAGLCLMTVLVNAGFLRDILRDRLADAVVPPMLLSAWVLGVCLGARWPRRVWQVTVHAIVAAAVVATSASAMRIGSWTERIESTGIDDGLEGMGTRAQKVSALLSLPHRQDVAPPSRVAAALLPFFAYVDRCSARSDQLIVTSDYPEIPVLAGRGFAGDGVVFGSWYSSARHQDLTAVDLRAKPPLFVLYIDAASFRARFPVIEQFVTEQYQPMADVPVEGAGTVSILAHRARVPASTDRATGWPCFASSD